MDMAESFDEQLHDQALTNIAQGMWPDTKDVEWVDVPDTRKIELNEQAQEMYLACEFISQANPKRYGRLKEELENDYTKGTYSYPQDMVKAYQLLNEYKHWTPRTYTPEASEIAFSQKTTKTKARKEEWKKKATCHMCGKKGHILPDCPMKEDEQDDEQVEFDESPKPKSN